MTDAFLQKHPEIAEAFRSAFNDAWKRDLDSRSKYPLETGYGEDALAAVIPAILAAHAVDLTGSAPPREIGGAPWGLLTNQTQTDINLARAASYLAGRKAGREEARPIFDAAKTALGEMCNTDAPRNSFTDAVDALDAAITRFEASLT